MTTTAERRVPLPRGAVSTEDWQPNDGGHYYRNFEGERRAVAAGTLYGADVIVYAHGVQHDDGTIDNGVTDPLFEPPSISMSTVNGDVQTDTCITLTADAARRLADVLITAADEVDRWSAR